jgi:hypothetical protein
VGYSQAELEDIQDRWELSSPPDLIGLMRKDRPLRPGGFDSLNTSATDIKRMLDWPYEGFLFDVRENSLWWPEWGPRPKSQADEAKQLAEVFAKAPKLIPLDGHRYLPETPLERGSPVFSVYQSDVIHYGADLADWLIRETSGWDIEAMRPPKEIPFWSEAVRRND